MRRKHHVWIIVTGDPDCAGRYGPFSSENKARKRLETKGWNRVTDPKRWSLVYMDIQLFATLKKEPYPWSGRYLPGA